jgi:hypothetical protein
MSRLKYNLLHQRFGRLLVIEKVWSERKKQTVWLCKCDCGVIKEIECGDLIKGKTVSCGCYNQERKENSGTHRSYNTRLYRIWGQLKNRTLYNPNYKYYEHISLCEEWKSFSNFKEWSLNNGYDDALTIDRIDVYGDYEPKNCRWIANCQQQRNKRNTIYLKIQGVERPLVTWCELFGIDKRLAYRRKHRGWKEEKWLIPPQPKGGE